MKTKISSLLAIVAAVVIAGTVGCGAPTGEARDSTAPPAATAAPSSAPAASDAQERGRPLTTASIREGQVRTLHLGPGVVTNAKLALTTVTVNVGAAATTASSAADPTLVGATAIGWVPGGNIDQVIDNIVVNGDGSITVTLGVAATAINNVKVVVVRAFGA